MKKEDLLKIIALLLLMNIYLILGILIFRVLF